MEIILVVSAILVLVWYVFHRRGNPQFWRAVRQHPEIAMAWFNEQTCWVVVHPGEPSPPSDDYTVGFAVFDPASAGMVKVHCRWDQINDSQAQFLVSLEAARL